MGDGVGVEDQGGGISAAELLEASPDAVVVVGSDGTIRHCTRAVRALFGYSGPELVGQPIDILVPEELRRAHMSNREAYLGDPVSRPMGAGLDLYGRRKDGSIFPVDIALAPLASGPDRRVAAFVRDASDRRRTQALLRDVNDISLRLLAGQPVPGTLTLVASRARALVDAACGWVMVPTGDGRLAVAAVDAEREIDLVGATVPQSVSHSGRAIASGAPVVILQMSDDPMVLAEARSLGLGPGLYLPLSSEQDSVGALVVARASGRSLFSRSEVAAAELFASAAGVVLALGRARSELEELQLTSDHERIARDLHDNVIQRLFAVGMGLQSVQRRAQGDVAERIESAVEAMDSVIRDIRETIFDLNRPEGQQADLRQRVGDITSDAAHQLGFRPGVSFRGPVETAADEELTNHLLAVLREALSNVGRHARASAAEVVIAADEAFVVLSVTDNGVGVSGDRLGGRGLGNMAERARQLGGRLEVVPSDGGGTTLEWRVPVRRG